MFHYKLWYSKNRDRLLAKMRFCRQQHTDRLRGYTQYYYTNNGDYFKEAHRLYVEQHREKAREYSRSYDYQNKEYYKALYESNKPKRLDTNRHTTVESKSKGQTYT